MTFFFNFEHVTQPPVRILSKQQLLLDFPFCSQLLPIVSAAERQDHILLVVEVEEKTRHDAFFSSSAAMPPSLYVSQQYITAWPLCADSP